MGCVELGSETAFMTASLSGQKGGAEPISFPR